MQSRKTKVRRSRDVSTWLAVLGVAIYLGSAPAAWASDQPTIVIYLSDDHSQFDCGLYGAKDIPTPNFESMAAKGMVFTHAFVASPSCAPSRAAMLTGLMPARNGAEANHTYPPKGTHYLTQDLKKCGYEVVAFGKVGHGRNQKRFGFDRVTPGASYANLQRNVKNYLSERKSDKPLCMFVGISNPHVPWSPEYSIDPAKVEFPPTHLDTPNTRIHRAAYYQEIKEVDLLMGELRSLVQKQFGDNVLFIHTSDHGSQWPFGKWTLYDYGTRVPFLVSWPGKIPEGRISDAMISWVDLIPTVLDLVDGKIPDKLDGRSFAPVLQGESKTHRQRIFTTNSGDGPMNIYPIRAVRTDRWKLIHNLHPEFAFTNHSDLHRKPLAGEYWTEWAELAQTDPQAKKIVDRYYRRPEWEFFDTQNDKWEQNNLIEDPSHQDQIRKMKAELADWMQEQGDKSTIYNTPRRLDDPKSWHPDYDNRNTPVRPRQKERSGNNAKVSFRTAASRPKEQDQWKPIETPIATEWAETLAPENAWTEYPRPQLKRERWKNLNGVWDFAVTKRNIRQPPNQFDGKILVPFSIESPLSGVGREVTQDETIWYRTTFTVKPESADELTLLNFEAADWETTAWVNGQSVGNHKGGYDPFSFDISSAIVRDAENELIVRVWDPQTRLFKSLGKQKATPKNYQRCSGIWQTVWLEQVPPISIEELDLRATADGKLTVKAEIRGDTSGVEIQYAIIDREAGKVGEIKTPANETGQTKIEDVKTWSPDSPILYDLQINLIKDGQVIDQVASYTGFRTISLGQFTNGVPILLNGKPIFQMGPLDQSYWPGGGLTPPSDEAMIWECQYLKDIGCNMVRLHIKQNPRRWYLHCDEMGLLVWQDFVSAQTMREKKQRRAIKPLESRTWMIEQAALMDTLRNHPSIVMWVVFNESWGQHNSNSMSKWTEKRDPTRLVSIASGWYDLPGVGQIRDIHDYTFHPSIPALGVEIARATVLGECGGFACAVSSHNWTGRSNKTGEPSNPLHGGFNPETPRDSNVAHDIFRPTFTAGSPMEDQYERFIDDLCLLKAHGLTAAVYTQMTDMKLEENGWLTFDRRVSKMSKQRLAEIHSKLYQPTPKRRSIISRGGDWEYALLPRKQSDSQSDVQFSDEPDFELAQWKQGKAPFGNAEIFGDATLFDGKQRLVIRRKFDLDQVPTRAAMQFYTYLKGQPADDGSLDKEWQHARVYLNGVFVFDESTRLTDPEQRVAEVNLHPEVLKHLDNGTNTIEVELISGLDPKRGKILDAADQVFFDCSLFEILE